MSIKSIALALDMDENTAESKVLASVKDLKLAKETAETALRNVQTKEADTLIAKGVSLGLIHKDFTDTLKEAFETNHDAQVVKLSKLIKDKEVENGIDAKHNVVKEVILGKGDGKGKAITLTFDYLQKHDVPKLKDIRDNNPTEYARLAKEYGAGVRYTE
ncbi:hypothetical protein PG913_08295 [Tenacibaculum pacificus]|uniref:hypothetical protein n=1 Tax=Tenacibaculum pacificus TaxID=3018314 RepID=UPI0022F3FA74|nr:hypothetical protein [Tenacibaculum pacificus]WBX72902.1 hypothetical protein PG913_08295 [Tenacibaculum pacificus]